MKKTFFDDSWAGPDDLHPWQVNGEALEDGRVRLETKGELFLTSKGGSISSSPESAIATSACPNRFSSSRDTGELREGVSCCSAIAP